MTELCAQYGISRKTGYKILKRYREEGPEALWDRSRAPHRRPNQTPPGMEAAVLRVRKAHPTWGSKKILAVLDREGLGDELPARSTGEVASLFPAEGLCTMAELERRAIERALESTGNDKRKAADMLGISRAKIYQRLKEWSGS